MTVAELIVELSTLPPGAEVQTPYGLATGTPMQVRPVGRPDEDIVVLVYSWSYS